MVSLPRWRVSAVSAAAACVGAASGDRGTYTFTVVPTPTSLYTWTNPPCCLVRPYTIAIPSPAPPLAGLVVKNGSKIRSIVA